MSAPHDALLLVAEDQRAAAALALSAAMLAAVLRVAVLPCAVAELAARAAELAAQEAARVVVIPAAPALDDALLAAQIARARRAAPALELVLAAPLISQAGVAALAAQRYRAAVGLPLAAAPHDAGGAALLPPRYRSAPSVSSAPMPAAPLVYDAEGRVAWDRIWGADAEGQPFCELALAGGPPHRAALLEPVTPAEVAADPPGYARALAELARGIRLTTGLATEARSAPGWVGVLCASEEMAIWLLRAIIVENISVRREGATLYLPAGPRFRAEHELRNVITALAKTHHYWQEHQLAIGD